MTGQAKYALNYCPELKRTRLLHIMVMGEVPPRMVICHFRGGAGGRVWSPWDRMHQTSLIDGQDPCKRCYKFHYFTFMVQWVTLHIFSTVSLCFVYAYNPLYYLLN